MSLDDITAIPLVLSKRLPSQGVRKVVRSVDWCVTSSLHKVGDTDPVFYHPERSIHFAQTILQL